MSLVNFEIGILSILSILFTLSVFVGKKSQDAVIYNFSFACFVLNIIIIAISGKNITAYSDYFMHIVTLIFGASSLFLLKQEGCENSSPARYFIAFFVIISAILMQEAKTIFNIYVLFEMQSLASAALISSAQKTKQSSEAGIKYIIFSAFASIFFLLGFSFVYLSQNAYHPNYLSSLGLVFILFSIFMRLGLFPFQIWIADVYSGVSFGVLNIINIFPKISGIFALCSVLNLLGKFSANGVIYVFIFFALFGVIFATIRSIVQPDIRRLIVYSGSVNIGILVAYILILFRTNFNMINVNKYIFAYILASLLLCICLVFIGDKNIDTKQDLRSKFFLPALVVSMLSMLGIPPFLGFFAKLNLVLGVYSFVNLGCIKPLFIFATFFATVIGSYYYLKFPSRWILLENKGSKNPLDKTGIALCFICILVLFFGFILI